MFDHYPGRAGLDAPAPANRGTRSPLLLGRLFVAAVLVLFLVFLLVRLVVVRGLAIRELQAAAGTIRR
jgi:flagellar biogenesis protein FliO